MPNKCKKFYVSRLNEMPWVKGDYSDVMVTMSRIYSTIRGDEVRRLTSAILRMMLVI